MKLAICGPSRCGKDVAAEWFRRNTTLRYWGSCSQVIAPVVAERLGVSEEHAFARRHQDRDLWRAVGDEMRSDDPAALARVVLSRGDLCVGIRSLAEITAVRDERLVDLIIWIDRRDIDTDPTLEYGVAMADIVIPNVGTLNGYHLRLRRLAEALGVLRASGGAA